MKIEHNFYFEMNWIFLLKEDTIAMAVHEWFQFTPVTNKWYYAISCWDSIATRNYRPIFCLSPTKRFYRRADEEDRLCSRVIFRGEVLILSPRDWFEGKVAINGFMAQPWKGERECYIIALIYHTVQRNSWF